MYMIDLNHFKDKLKKSMIEKNNKKENINHK